MDDKKFYGIGIILGVLTIVIGSFEPVLGVLIGIFSLWLNIKNKKQYRIKIGIACTIVGMFIALRFLGWILWLGIAEPYALTDYWLYELLFGKM